MTTPRRLARVLGACAFTAIAGLALAQGAASTEPPATACVGDSPSGAPTSAAGLSAFARQDVKAIAEQVTCYCGCPHLQVSKCFCGTADDIREWIAARLDKGMTPEAIIAEYVAEHGTWVMAEPPKRGFNWIIWVGPFAVVVLGAAALFIMGRRWSATRPAAAEPALDAASQARLREQLERALERES